MNTVLVPTLLAAAVLLPSTAVRAADLCDPAVVRSETRYPLSSQLRNQTGTVYVEVAIDSTGQARSARLAESSGFQRLDRAAVQSVLGDWRFDVSSCERSDLPINEIVAVQYRATP